MNVQSSVLMPSPRLSNLTSRITRNNRKKLILMMLDPAGWKINQSDVSLQSHSLWQPFFKILFRNSQRRGKKIWKCCAKLRMSNISLFNRYLNFCLTKNLYQKFPEIDLNWWTVHISLQRIEIVQLNLNYYSIKRTTVIYLGKQKMTIQKTLHKQNIIMSSVICLFVKWLDRIENKNV